MRKYTNEVTYIPQSKKDEFVFRSRQQAFNIGFSRFIIAVLIIGCIQYTMWQFFTFIIVHFLFPLALAYGLLEYSNALKEFTYEDREFLVSRYGLNEKQEIIIPEEQTITKNDNSILPMGKGSGSHILHIGLTKAQKEHIAKCAIDKGNLTINYLQSLGLSRQQSELLRSELAQFGIVQFNKREEAIVTDYGEKVFKRVLK